MKRTFVGFGFGPIQAGLFLAEAQLSGNFGRLVVAEVLPDVVAAVRRAGGCVVNIGHADRVVQLHVRPLEIYQPALDDERARLVEAVAAAAEMATALPSVDHYTQGGAGAVHRILAAGLLRKADGGGPRAVVYTAENHTRAAELLEQAVLGEVPAGARDRVRAQVQFLDTVIGKMSGAPGELGALAPIAPGLNRTFLVEAFNRILVSQVDRTAPGWADYQLGISVFSEKPDLQPFAEAKLYGHNAGHALAAYLASELGLTRIDELSDRPDVVEYVRTAMIRESGAPLCRRHAGVDPLFTPAGFKDYVDDLIVRMVNPYVRDTVERVGRDPARKLRWDDRLVGAMRHALAIGIEPARYAVGCAGALDWLGIAPERTAEALRELWQLPADAAAEAEQVIARVEVGWGRLGRWKAAGFPVVVAEDGNL